MLNSQTVQVLILLFEHVINPIMNRYLTLECTRLIHFGVPRNDLVVTKLGLETTLLHLFYF